MPWTSEPRPSGLTCVHCATWRQASWRWTKQVEIWPRHQFLLFHLETNSYSKHTSDAIVVLREVTIIYDDPVAGALAVSSAFACTRLAFSASRSARNTANLRASMSLFANQNVAAAATISVPLCVNYIKVTADQKRLLDRCSRSCINQVFALSLNMQSWQIKFFINIHNERIMICKKQTTQ